MGWILTSLSTRLICNYFADRRFDTATETFSTLKKIVPIPLDLRALYCSDVIVEKVILKKKEEDFEFLEEETEKKEV